METAQTGIEKAFIRSVVERVEQPKASSIEEY